MLVNDMIEYVKNMRINLLILVIFMCYAPLAHAQEPVLVGGTLTESQVWTKNYLYIVTDDLYIPNGIELIIEAGVTVRFNQGTAMVVELGRLKILGVESDSVRLIPNYIGVQQWKWRGLTYLKVSGEGNNVIHYASIVNAEQGIEMISAEHVVVTNTYLAKNQWRGLRIVSSSGCRVSDCEITTNYVGIEMYASGMGNITADNVIENSYIGANQNANIILLNDNEGVIEGNLIRNNLIDKTLNGIRFDRGNNAPAAVNTFSSNRIVSNGQGFGFGMYLTMDSTRVQNNIFWLNTNALTLRAASACVIENNSFLNNSEAISLQEGSLNTVIRQNTFSKQDNRILNLNSAPHDSIVRNNIFRQKAPSNYVRNNTAIDVGMQYNYWTSTISDSINTFIWDKNDSPSLGRIVFEPFLTDPDTIAPVSPPDQFFKQVINGEVVFRWKPNPESDIAGYRLHYGPFFRYRFPFQSEPTNDTSMIINGITLTDSVAITAFDTQGFGLPQQLLGHESPFIFPQAIPFSGPDTAICKSTPSFEVITTTVPFSFQELTWFSSGDGSFDDASVLYPNYSPGPLDHINGSVTITLTVVKDNKTYSDSFVITFINSPFVWAGNDTILSPDSALLIQWSQAAYYDVLFWETTGDGTFDDSGSLQTSYLPGPGDKVNGEVSLILTASSTCGIARDTLLLKINQLYRISGVVRSGNEVFTRAVVLAVRTDISVTEVVAMDMVQDDGSFQLKNLFGGHYLLYAVPDTLSDRQYAPAYYLHKTRWQDAYPFNLEADVFDVDVHLTKLHFRNKNGIGVISGRFLLPEDEVVEKEIFCQPWFSPLGDEVDFCSEGLANMTIMLFNPARTHLIDYTLTDPEGYFWFNQLPYGQYLIEAEKPGYISGSSGLIELKPENPIREDVLLEINQKNIIFTQQLPPTARILTATVHPNPVKSQFKLTVQGEDLSNLTFECFDAYGRSLPLTTNVISENGPSATVTIQADQWVKGIYILRTSSPQHTSVSLKIIRY